MKFEVTEKHCVKIDNEYCGENDDTRCEYNYGTPSHYCKKFHKGLVTYFISNRDSGRQLRCDECKKLFSNSKEKPTVNRWEIFQKSYDDSIESIHHAMENNDETYPEALECQHLIKWLFETKHNPYSIFEKDPGHAGWMGSAEGFDGLCAHISHDICDDGDICYPVINGRPSIYFGWKHDDSVKEYLLKEDEHAVRIHKEMGRYKPPILVFLDNAYEFTKAYDAYEKQQLERYAKWEELRGKIE